MITIDRHISRLISRHDCVIVPGFGAFLAQRLPAYYNADDKLYLPPRRTLVFTPHVTMDDALLSTAYMEDYGISHNQATILMQETEPFPSIHTRCYLLNGRVCSLYEIGRNLSRTRLNRLVSTLHSQGCPCIRRAMRRIRCWQRNISLPQLC